MTDDVSRARDRDLPVSDLAVSRLLLIARAVLAFEVAGCSLLLIAWLWGQDWLTRVALNDLPIRPNAATGLILLGVAALLLAREPVRRRPRIVASVLASIAVLVGIVTLIEWIAGTDTGLDTALSSLFASEHDPGERMPIQTAALLIVFGSVLLTIDWRTPSGRWPAGYVVTAGALIAGMALVGHAYEVPSLYNVGSDVAFARGAAASFLAIALAVACSRPHRGMVGIMTDKGTGGRIGRLMLPPSMLLPPLIGALALAGHRAGFYGGTVAVWMVAALLIVACVLYSMRASFIAYALDQERIRNQRALHRNEQELRTIVDTAQDAFVQLDGDGTLRDWNRQAERLFGWSREEALGRDAIATLVPERLRGQFASLLERVQEGDGSLPIRGEATGMHRDGGELPAEMAVSWGVVGGELRINLFVHDISERKRFEGELQQARARLQGIFDNSPAAIYIKDRLGRYVAISRECERQMGAKADDIVGKTVRDLSPDYAPELEAIDRKVLTTGATHSQEFEFVADGKTTNQIAVRFPLLDESGKPNAVCGIALDITEQRRTQKKLLEAEEQYRSLVDELPLVTYIKPVDRAGALFLSPHVERMLGYEAGELINGNVELDQLIHPEDRERVLAATAHSKATGERLTQQYRMIARDGRLVWVREEGSCRLDPEGTPIALHGYLKDITESKQADEDLLASRDQLETMIGTMADGLVFGNADGELVLWNAAAERIIGSRLDYTALADRAKHFGFYRSEEGSLLRADELPLQRAIGGEYVEDFLMFVRNPEVPDGIWINTSASPITLPDGSSGGGVIVFRDVSDRIRAERDKQAMRERLTRAERLETVGQLAGGIAHDFNNLLAVIKTYAGFLEPAVEGEAERDLSQVLMAADRAGELTRQLLVFSRRDPAKQHVIDLSELITGGEGLLRPLLGDDIALELSLGGAGTVRADPAQIEQVLMNLASNSRDAMPNGGRVKISTEPVVVDPGDRLCQVGLPPGPYIRLTMADDGPGMPADVAARVFEPFFTTKSAGQGTGLGLATVYGIVADCNGHIDLNTKQGRGAEFVIHIPMSGAPVAAPEVKPPVVPIHESNGETVLVVEDEGPVLTAAVRILSSHGYAVLEASDGEKAQRIVDAGAVKVDLLLTDVRMYPISGVDLADRMRQSIPGLRVLYMSGYPGDPASLDADLLEKPFDAEQLLGAVARIFDAPAVDGADVPRKVA